MTLDMTIHTVMGNMPSMVVGCTGVIQRSCASGLPTAGVSVRSRSVIDRAAVNRRQAVAGPIARRNTGFAEGSEKLHPVRENEEELE